MTDPIRRQDRFFGTAIASATPHDLVHKVSNAENRIASLDGLRAIAILAVALFHYYYLFPHNVSVSDGTANEEVLFFQYGWFGVMLFFSISGFVITQTLHHSNNPAHFIGKRFSRLFPAMLLCSALTYAVSFILPVTYTASVYNFLPSLTFLDPGIFNFIFRTHAFDWMDGAYWSLFTEMRFYAMAAVIYFLSRSNFYRNFLILASLVGVIFPAAIYLQLDKIRSVSNFLFIANQLPWFVFGVACYYLHHKKNRAAIAGVLISFISMSLYIVAITKRPYMPFDGAVSFVAMLVIFALVFCAIRVQCVNKSLSFKPLVAIGMASYSLYLLHQEIGQKLIQITERKLPVFTGTQYAIPVLILIVGILTSLAIYAFYEKPMNKKLNQFFYSRC